MIMGGMFLESESAEEHITGFVAYFEEYRPFLGDRRDPALRTCEGLFSVEERGWSPK